MKLFLSVLSPFHMVSTPGKGAVISLSGVIWYVRPSQAAACDSDIISEVNCVSRKRRLRQYCAMLEFLTLLRFTNDEANVRKGAPKCRLTFVIISEVNCPSLWRQRRRFYLWKNSTVFRHSVIFPKKLK